MREFLRKSRGLRGLRDDAVHLRERYLTGRDAAIRRYLAAADEPALHLGANQSSLPGWLETDISLVRADLVYLDAEAPFPLPDKCMQFIYAEHMIEHIGRDSGRSMLRECRRVLKPGGVLRLTTPDLAFVLSLYEPTEDGLAYIGWISERFGEGRMEPTPANVINNAFRAWGHQHLYDECSLSLALQEAGFMRITRCGYGESAHDRLRGIEQHAVNVGNEPMVKLETMVIEAV